MDVRWRCSQPRILVNFSNADDFLVCSRCSQLSLSHLKMSDPSEVLDIYTCCQCSYQAISSFQRNYHVQRHHKNVRVVEVFHAIFEPEQFSCISCCDYKTYYRFDIYEHYKQATNQTIKNTSFCKESAEYPCDYCSFESDSILSFLEHQALCLKKSSTGPRAEDAEPKTNGDYGAVKSNIITSTHGSSENQLKCNHCAFRTKYKSAMKRHNLSKHVADKELDWLHCNNCSYRAKLKSNLIRHMRKHAPPTGETNWLQCRHCSHRCKQIGHLRRHMLQHATNEEINWFRCDHCSYRAKQSCHLKMHLLKHAADEEIDWFQCNHCSYRAKRKSHLQQHMWKHVTGKDITWFQCEHCSYRSKRKSHLKRHALQHAASEEIKWFQCNLCSYRTKENSSLARHMLTQHAANEEIKWFQCDFCPYRAKVKSSLKSHMLVHAADEEIDWFECSQCSYRTKRKSDWKAHNTRMLHHKKNTIRSAKPSYE